MSCWQMLLFTNTYEIKSRAEILYKVQQKLFYSMYIYNT